MKRNILLMIFLFSLTSFAQNEPIKETVEGYRVEPAKIKFDETLLKNLSLPEGFNIQVFAKDLGKPRMIAVDNNFVYITHPKKGEILLLKDNDGDGKSDEKSSIISGYKDVHGITINKNKLYFCTPKELYSADLNNNGTLSEPEKILDDLPDGGQHPNRTIAFGPDNLLYISIGSSCNACEETNEEHATIIQVNENGKNRKIFAKGLRNTIGFDWHPVTNILWGMDHGSDFRGNDLPPEELNKIEEGKDYGWRLSAMVRKLLM